MQTLLSNPLLLAALPMGIALVLGLGGRALRGVAPLLAAIGPLLAVAVAAAALSRIVPAEGGPEGWLTSTPVSTGALPWFRVGDAVLSWSWTLDSLSALMLGVVGVVALCVIVFSIGYMHGDKGYSRYFALISLFTGSMNLLVLAAGFTTVFVGWELVGACSFLLIGFWYEKPSAAAAAIKAFLTTRVGDVGLLLGIALLWAATGAESYHGALAAIEHLDPTIVTAAAICIAIGAMGKSAQFPLHGWLPDAMEGPTPVSALIHAATMVAAGVFLVARVWPLFEAAEAARTVLMVAGAVSALGAAGAAVAQRDIKKVLAYSTISQLGFMFAALGAEAWVAAFFHLIAHAAFKALLFLGSGSVIHGTGTQDLHEMGGLRTTMPVTFVTWMAGVLALAGVFPFAGFFSKDAVLEHVWAHAPVVGIALFVASALTAFYAARVTRLAFFGTPAEGLHAHESGLSMLVPLIALAVPAIALGFASGAVTSLLGHEPEPLAIAVSAAALTLAAVGGIAGWLASAGPAGDSATRARTGALGDTLAAAYRWDALVDRVIVQPTVAASRALWAIGDRFVADGVAEGAAEVARRIGVGFSRMQSGDAQSYTTAFVVAVIVMLLVSVWAGRWIG